MIISVLIILVLVMAVYISLILPERRNRKRRAVMLDSIAAGTILFTEDGIRGRVERVKDRHLLLSCFPDSTLLIFDLKSVKQIENYNEKAAIAKMKEKRKFL